MSTAKQVTVRVDGENVEVWLAKTGAVTWRAWANFRGKQIEATGMSESNATGKWQVKADYLSKE